MTKSTQSSTRISQIIHNTNVYEEARPGRGTGLFASQDLRPGAQALFVSRPLMVALDTPRLQDTCYRCFQSKQSVQDQEIRLRACTGCHVVKFCGKDCQTPAWTEYHKFECKLFSKLLPRILPSTARAVVRLLKQHRARILPAGEWEQILQREAHQDDLGRAGGEQWENLCLTAKGVQTYSGTQESIETVLRICCILTLNSFTLTTPTLDPLGLAMHPLPALINHSCNPNAIIRFDVPLRSTPQSPTLGSISAHAIRPISHSEELTISYVDATNPFADRQAELESRYFFTCSCPLCVEGRDSITDRFLAAPSDSKATALLEDLESKASTILQQISSASNAEILAALSIFESTNNWPLHRHPLTQLRHELILGFLSVQQFGQALMHSLVMVWKVNTQLYRDTRTHPVRLVRLWTTFKLTRYLLASSTSTPNTATKSLSYPAATTTTKEIPTQTKFETRISKETQKLAHLSYILLDDLLASMNTEDDIINPTGGALEASVLAARAEIINNTTASSDGGTGERALWNAYTRQKDAVRKEIDIWVEDVILHTLKAERE